VNAGACGKWQRILCRYFKETQFVERERKLQGVGAHHYHHHYHRYHPYLRVVGGDEEGGRVHPPP
jgi:hypothetical protein